MPRGVYVRTGEYKAKMSLALTGEKNPMFGKTHSEEYKAKMSLVNIGENNPNFGKTGEKHPMFGKTHSEEAKAKMSLSHTGKTHSEESKVKISLAKNDIWYGGVKYNNERKYCELWTPELLTRIRSFFENISVLSGKTKSENGNRNMSCHHVYYQKKACCIWDEDAQGYYAIIDGEKYYIKGDPNKFVTLTAGENTMVEYDKLKWVKIFEDIIENEYDGKCYYTKEEYDLL